MSETLTQTSAGVSEQAAKLTQDTLVWDNLFPCSDGTRELQLQLLHRVKNCGYDFVTFTLGEDSSGIKETIKNIASARALVLSEPDNFMLVDTADDVTAAKQAGKLAISFHFQGTGPVESDLDMIEVYYSLGVRQMLLATNLRNMVGDGCKERTDCGLSRFGVLVIEEMNRVGMLVDGSHTGNRTTLDACEISKDPFIFSHSNPKAIFDHPRNITDEQIKASAATGGVIGINGVGCFLARTTVRRRPFCATSTMSPNSLGPNMWGSQPIFRSILAIRHRRHGIHLIRATCHGQRSTTFSRSNFPNWPKACCGADTRKRRLGEFSARTGSIWRAVSGSRIDTNRSR